jgi:DNA-binding MarR family transcriptional regulator
VIESELSDHPFEDVMASGSTKVSRLAERDYQTLAAFRHALRHFLSFSEMAANDAGLAPQQYQALLALKGCPAGGKMTIDDLAGQLLVRHNSAVGLVDRLEAERLVRRQVEPSNRRKINLHLTPKGDRILERLAAAHRAELRRVEPQLRLMLKHLSRGAGRGRRSFRQ